MEKGMTVKDNVFWGMKKVKLVDRGEMERGERKEGRRQGREEVYK